MKEQSPQTTLVLIPAYNEERNIQSVVSAVSAKGYPVLVVNDGSSDDTAAEAGRGGAEVLSFESNQGKGAALRAGFEKAAELGYDRVVLMDGDGQHSPDEIDTLVKAFDESGADMLIGSRMDSIENMPFIRKMTNILMSKIVSWLAHSRVKDTQSGFRMMRTDLLKAIHLRTKRFDTESEMIIRAGRKGFTISETPISTIYGTGEKSSIRPVIDTVRFLRLVLLCIFS